MDSKITQTETEKIDAAMAKIEKENGRVATDQELADELEISLDEYNTWLGQTKSTNLISLDEYTDSGSEVKMDASINKVHFEQPEEVIEKDELKKMIVESLNILTEKEKNVVLLYYYEDMTLKEISCVLEVSESRVSQLHTRALQKMKTKLGTYLNIFE